MGAFRSQKTVHPRASRRDTSVAAPGPVRIGVGEKEASRHALSTIVLHRDSRLASRGARRAVAGQLLAIRGDGRHRVDVLDREPGCGQVDKPPKP